MMKNFSAHLRVQVSQSFPVPKPRHPASPCIDPERNYWYNTGVMWHREYTSNMNHFLFI